MQFLMTKEEYEEAIAKARHDGRFSGRFDLAETIIGQLEGKQIVMNGCVGLEAELIDSIRQMMEKLVSEGKRADEWKQRAEGYALKESKS